MQTQAPVFNAWLDDFFAAYYRRRPVNATFIGVHEYDEYLPDFSEAGAGDTLAEMETLLHRLRHLPPETVNDAEALDRTLAEGFLEIQIWEHTSNRFHLGNPTRYTGEAIFGTLALFLTDFAPLDQRVGSAIARMEAIPEFLAQGVANLHQAPQAWTARAIDECIGARAFFGKGIEQLIRDKGIGEPSLRAAATKASAAFAKFQHTLETELRAHPTADYACGEPAFDLLMRRGHLLDMEADEIVRYGEAQVAEAQAYLDAHAAQFGAASRQEALAQLADLHPTVEGYYDHYTEIWEACRATTLAHDLLTWPDFPIRYVPRPHWSREAAPYLYFLSYRAPAAVNRPEVHNYLVTPIESSMPVAEQETLLRANNDSVIKLNHVVHHGGIGHHVQNWYAYRAPSRVGRIAAVDCASRIAMFCAGTMAEGWAVYATELMGEVGFLSPLELYAEQQSRRRMAARAVVDVRLHSGRMTLDEAANYYRKQAGMSSAAARGEAVKNSMFPGAAMMYLFGSERIRQLRQEMERRWGSQFTLHRFHDTFLSYGSIPVALIAEEMERKAYDAQ